MLRCPILPRLWGALALALVLAPVTVSTTAASEEEDGLGYRHATAGDYGNVGILATRSARFHPDGTLNVSATFISPYRRFAINFQALPFLEATFRYTQVLNRSFSIGGLPSEEAFRDRGADLKLRLAREGRWMPELAVGLQDGLGTGLFSGEFLVGTKRFYDLDFSLGIGWGQLGSAGTIPNPLCKYIDDSFCVRGGAGIGTGGAAALGNYFSGETIGLFGGVQWFTPVRGLILSAEIDGNSYDPDPLSNDLGATSRFNFGITYRPVPWFEMAGAFERGNTAMFRVSLRSNLTDPDIPKFDPPPPEVKPLPKAQPIEASDQRDAHLMALPPAPTGRPMTAQLRLPGDPVPVAPKRRRAVAERAPPARARPDPAQDPTALVDALFDGLESKGFVVEGIETAAQDTVISVSKGLSTAGEEDIADAFEVISGTLPQSANRITLVETTGGREVRRISMGRDEIEQTAIVDYLFDGLEAQGFALDGVELSHREVALLVTQAPPDDDGGERRAAAIAFNALPVPVERVAIVRMHEGEERSRVHLRRRDVLRATRIDQLFDEIEARGFEINSLEMSKRRATIYVTPHDPSASPDYRAAADLATELAPEPLDAVEVIGLSAGVEIERVTLKRATPGTASGADREYIPDLSDNEKREIALKVFKDLDAQGFRTEAFRITRHRATIFVTPIRFRQYARNVGWVSRIVANHVPASVEEIEVVTMSAGLETGRVVIMRQDLERAVVGSGSPEEIWANAIIPGPAHGLPPRGTVPKDAINNPRRYPSLSLYIRPALRQHIGGPDAFWLYQIWLAITARVELYRGLSVAGTLGRNIVHTFDEITLTSDSQLPKVRSRIKDYLQEGADGNIVHLDVQYVFQPFQNWYGRLAAGLLEEMYGGVGGEVLYRPFGSRLAVGADMFRVRQRAFDQRFEFLDYAITTGHVNVYYKWPYLRLVGEVHAGQFLAGDRGAQFVLSRVFRSGFQVGAWATFTDVPFEVFGEGSFDKGFFIRIPFEVFLPNSTRRQGTFAFRPLTRDGGQMAGRTKELYGLIEEGNLDNVMRDWDRFLD